MRREGRGEGKTFAALQCESRGLRGGRSQTLSVEGDVRGRGSKNGDDDGMPVQVRKFESKKKE